MARYEQPTYRFLVEQVVPRLMERFEMIDYDAKCVRSPYFPEAVPLDVISKFSAAVECFSYPLMDNWKPYFQKHYHRMTVSPTLYKQYVNYVLHHLAELELGVFDRMVASWTFVICSTVYFTQNGHPQALRHPTRLLVTFFEKYQWFPFRTAGDIDGMMKYLRRINCDKILEKLSLTGEVEHTETCELGTVVGRIRGVVKLDEMERVEIERHVPSMRPEVIMPLHESLTRRPLNRGNYRDDDLLKHIVKNNPMAVKSTGEPTPGGSRDAPTPKTQIEAILVKKIELGLFNLKGRIHVFEELLRHLNTYIRG